jgi:hypothetical protein
MQTSNQPTHAAAANAQAELDEELYLRMVKLGIFKPKQSTAKGSGKVQLDQESSQLMESGIALSKYLIGLQVGDAARVELRNIIIEKGYKRISRDRWTETQHVKAQLGALD